MPSKRLSGRSSRPLSLGTDLFGQTVHLPESVRATHMHVLGASGRGKSKLLEHLIREDVRRGHGLCLIDPHGYLYRDLIRWLETNGFADDRQVILFEPGDGEWTFAFNPLDFRGEELSFGVDAMVRACAAVWGGEDSSRTPLLKRCLRSVFYVLAEKELSLLEALELINPLSADGIRRYLTSGIRDPVFAAQWDAFNALRPGEFQEQFSSTANRLLEFLSAPIVRRTIGQTERTVDFRRIMDEGAVVLVNLAPQGRVSDDNARLLGTLLVNDLFLKARGRPPGSRPFYLYIDECARYVNEDIARILDEARKFGLHLVLAHQHLAQLRRAGEDVYSAVMTNAQTKVVFGGLSPEDAEIVARQVFMGEYDLEAVKHAFDAYRVVGYRKTLMRSGSRSQSSTEAGSWGGSEYAGESVLDPSAFEASDTPPIPTLSRGEGASWSRSRSDSEGVSEGVSEAFEPVLELGPSQGYQLAELDYLSAARLINQACQHAVVKLPNEPSRSVTVPRVRAAVARDERVERFRFRSFEESGFVAPRLLIEAELDKRRERLREMAKEALRPSEPVSFRE
jgi:hypothetical protein